MLRSAFLSVSVFALLAGTAHAQNYVRTENLSGPNVVIDFGALDQASAAKNQWAVGPAVQQQTLDAPAPPPKLMPPTPKQAMAMTPVMDGTETLDKQRPLPSLQHMQQADITPHRAAAPPVAAPAPAPMPAQAALPPAAPASNNVPPPTNFAARDMIDSAPPALSAKPMPTPVATPAKPSVPSTSPNSMLATARTNAVSNNPNRVNLASISDGPPLPIRTQEPVTKSEPVGNAAPKPVAKPIIEKPAAIVPKQQTAPIAKSSPSLPPSGSLDDLISDDSDKPVMAKASTKANALPSGVTALDNEDRPASASLVKTKTSKVDNSDLAPVKPAVKKDNDDAMQVASIAPIPASSTTSPPLDSKTVSLSFAKDAGTLDDAAKKNLDQVVASLKKDASARAQIRAYASGTPETSGQARRLSLTRALAIRSYIVDHDLPATRLDIRALGNGQGAMGDMDKASAGQSMDRVDIVLAK